MLIFSAIRLTGNATFYWLHNEWGKSITDYYFVIDRTIRYDDIFGKPFLIIYAC